MFEIIGALSLGYFYNNNKLLKRKYTFKLPIIFIWISVILINLSILWNQ